MHKDKKDSEIIEEYYDTYEQKIFRLANAILGDTWQAEEAVQETFLKIIRHRDVVRRMADDKRAAYITRIAKNISIIKGMRRLCVHFREMLYPKMHLRI